ncbi:hypothetical protein GCM10009799_25520 [Nocardiopsis rhodophaea]|uniref:Uncharacterized protein n=1 Tax=Nocardiopsis rhodophaea TaxID=280238 RepID=A0ABN2T304_9ACTN
MRRTVSREAISFPVVRFAFGGGVRHRAGAAIGWHAPWPRREARPAREAGAGAAGVGRGRIH